MNESLVGVIIGGTITAVFSFILDYINAKRNRKLSLMEKRELLYIKVLKIFCKVNDDLHNFEKEVIKYVGYIEQKIFSAEYVEYLKLKKNKLNNIIYKLKCIQIKNIKELKNIQYEIDIFASLKVKELLNNFFYENNFNNDILNVKDVDSKEKFCYINNILIDMEKTIKYQKLIYQIRKELNIPNE